MPWLIPRFENQNNYFEDVLYTINALIKSMLQIDFKSDLGQISYCLFLLFLLLLIKLHPHPHLDWNCARLFFHLSDLRRTYCEYFLLGCKFRQKYPRQLKTSSGQIWLIIVALYKLTFHLSICTDFLCLLCCWSIN